ncbi:MAG: cysteine--tRNA ligase [Planctomycetota bacterium]
MDLRLYNTYTRDKQLFEPIEEGKVRMYHCGPTVYQRPHIGNYRAFLFADLLRRVFEVAGYEVQQVMNLTDVGHLLDDADEGEDKLEAQARKDKLDPWQVVEQVSRQFFADLDDLGVQPAHAYPRATDHIEEMVEMIEVLIDKGHAYRVGDNVYFEVASFPAYGRLSGNRIEDLEAGARLEVNMEKRHPADFALWKSDAKHIMKWETEFGADGFPGWHIECSAMARKYLGDHFDIHTGGEDNVFPHHECEIAQSVCALDGPFVNLWMHTKFLQVDGGKMGKSLGNAYTLDDLRDKGFSPLDFRLLLLRGNYRNPLNFTWEALQGAAEARANLNDFRNRLLAVTDAEAAVEVDLAAMDPASAVAQARFDFLSGLADDLNSSEALAALFTLRNAFQQGKLSAEDHAAALSFLLEADRVFGFLDAAASSSLSDADIDALIVERGEARSSKDFARADAIRDELDAAGITLEDTSNGVKWFRG